MTNMETVKKITICFLFLIILFVGCTPNNSSNATQIIENEKYTLIWEQDECYLSINNLDEYSSLDSQTQNMLSRRTTIVFDSIEDMKDTIASGNFVESDMIRLANYFPKDDQGRVKICNISQLYYPDLPNEMVDSTVYWQGETYSFSLNSEIGINGQLSYLTHENYSDRFERDYTNYFESNELIQLETTSYTTDRNATIYDYSTSSAELRQLRYCIETTDKTLYIDELYVLNIHDDVFPESETIPHRIDIYGYTDEGYFYINLFDFIERPSVEWLSSFGLTEYVESNNTVTE